MNGLKYWIALSETNGIGPVSLTEIHKTLSSLSLSVNDLFECDRDEIISDFSFSPKLADTIIQAKNIVDNVEDDYLAMIEAKITVIPFFAPSYPKRLLDIMKKSFPPILYVLGDASIMNDKGIAILGDADVSARGETISFKAARELARNNIITISGMAKGAGLLAHRSAVINGGKTTAVIPCGMLQFKLPEMLADVINLDNTAIVSPFYPSKESSQFNAFMRNKLICALSCAVFIVEAPEEGGIFEAAKSAQKLNIPLYTTKYGEYPENAKGNILILEQMGGHPVKRRKESAELEPNVDQLMAHAKFA